MSSRVANEILVVLIRIFLYRCMINYQWLFDLLEIESTASGLIGYLSPCDKYIWVNLFNNRPSKILGRQPKKFEVIWSA